MKHPRLSVVRTRTKEDVSRSKRKLSWVTRAQLIKIYGGQTEVVDAIINETISEGAFKAHPDLPDHPLSCSLSFLEVRQSGR